MNTIKIILAESGRIADLKKDFPLFKGGYKNKLLNVLVPTSIMAPEYRSYIDGTNEIDAEFVAGTALKIGMKTIARDGKYKLSKSYFMRYVKRLTYQGVEYALFERKMPKEFTLYEGQGANAPILICNVVTVQTEAQFITQGDNYIGEIDGSDFPNNTALNQFVQTEKGREPQVDDVVKFLLQKDGTVKIYKYVFNTTWTKTEITSSILEITTSQECKLDVMPSGDLDEDEAIEPSELEEITAQITSIIATLLLKQNITDAGLHTTNKTIVGAINEIKAWVEENIVTGEHFVSLMSGQTLPTPSQLNAKVYAVEGRQPQNGDVIIFTHIIAGATDKSYKYFYTQGGWESYEIPTIENASNGTLGLVKGSYSIGLTNGTLVDINDGVIENIYVKDTTGAYHEIRAYLNTLFNDLEIVKNTMATKTFVKNYALPREFNDTFYIASSGYLKTPPTTPISGIQFTATSTHIGDTTIFQIEKTSDAQYQLGNKNSCHNSIYIDVSANCNVQFRLTTEAKIGTGNWKSLGVQLSEVYELTAQSLKKIDFDTIFTLLGDDVITLDNGDKIRQTLEVVTDTSSSLTFNVYSNSIYPSTFNLIVQSLVIYHLASQLQYDEMPEASAEFLNRPIQYIGETDANYIHGYFYESKLDEDTETYSWERVILQEQYKGSEYISVDDGEEGTADEGYKVVSLDETNLEKVAPQEDSDKLITSGAVYDALSNIEGVTEIQLSGTSGTLTDAQFAKVQENPSAVVFSLGGRKFIHNEDATNYVSYSNVVYPTTDTQEIKVIYVNTSSEAVNYKHWNVETENPSADGIKAVVITLVSEQQSTGTLTQEQLDTLTENDSNYIETSYNGHNEKYYFNTEASEQGYRVYMHLEDESGIKAIKSFTITESVKTWVIVDTPLASKSYVDTQIGNIDTLLQDLDSGSGV